MVQHLHSFVSSGSGKPPLSALQVLTRATLLALGMALLLLLATGVLYLGLKGLSWL